LRSLRKEFGKKVPFILIMSSEAFQNFLTWLNPMEILTLTNLVVANRAGYPQVFSDDLKQFAKQHAAKNIIELLAEPSGKILFTNVTPLKISATEIRNFIKNGNSRQAQKFLPTNVWKYIEKTRLYRK
jgi:nicotinic acid mononucleotide adenylyltransferase